MKKRWAGVGCVAHIHCRGQVQGSPEGTGEPGWTLSLDPFGTQVGGDVQTFRRTGSGVEPVLSG